LILLESLPNDRRLGGVLVRKNGLEEWLGRTFVWINDAQVGTAALGYPVERSSTILGITP
jgi:hypothetical protein